jgi:predicted CXXCH cytochrome family protein
VKIRISLATVMLLTYINAVRATDAWLEVLVPPRQISVHTDYLHVVGRTSAEKVRVIVNDRQVQEVKVVDSVFHAHVSFGYGLHEISLVPVECDSHTVVTGGTDLEVLYGPHVARKYQRIYYPYVFHNSRPRDDCTGCHASTCEDLSKVADESTCLVCHTDFRQRFGKHTKVDDRTCINCHYLDKNLTSGTLDYPGENSCYLCHKNKILAHSQEYIHGPVAGGKCTICHDPHGTQYEKNLRNPEQILCFSCHEDTESDLRKRFVHQPFLRGQCGECHDPHSTNNRWVLVKRSEELCLSCHGQQEKLKTHNHPYNVTPKKPLRVDLKLTEDGKLECLSCHEPHSAKVEHLLTGIQEFSCISCHDDKQ